MRNNHILSSRQELSSKNLFLARLKIQHANNALKNYI